VGLLLRILLLAVMAPLFVAAVWPATFQNLLELGICVVVLLLLMALPVRIVLIALTRTSLRLDSASATLRVVPSLERLRRCRLADVRVRDLDFEDSAEGGHDPVPLYFLPLELGRERVSLFLGHSREDLEHARSTLLAWLSAHGAA
jgi:hypothetical protein